MPHLMKYSPLISINLSVNNSEISYNLAYDLGTVANHQSVSFGYEYVMAVPEPETYAMLLAGLGLIGFSARRRRVM